MKTLLWGLIMVLTGIGCSAQKYETWVLQSNSKAKIKGNIVSYDDYGMNHLAASGRGI